MPAIVATRIFRLKIVACLLLPGWMRKYGTIILPAYFDQQDESALSEFISEHYAKYHHPPDKEDTLSGMGEEYRRIIEEVFEGKDTWDLDFAGDVAVQFAQEQAARIAVLESLPDIEKGSLDTVVSRLKEAMKVGQDLQDVGLDLKNDVTKWLYESQLPKVPTGLIHLDIAMEGGLAAGELGVIVAPPNYGKSMALVNIGHGAMGPVSKATVVHFSLEMSKTSVAKRYSARSIFRFPKPGDDLAEYGREFSSIAKYFLPGQVRIIRMDGSIQDIRTRINRLIDVGYEPDLIIVDYGDLIKPTRFRNDRYSELGDVFQELRELGSEEEYNCPVWTATQANRGSLGKEVITMADLAESFQKAMVADAMVAICQTRTEEQNGQGRLFVAKLRDAESRAMIRVKILKAQQAIITEGFVSADRN